MSWPGAERRREAPYSPSLTCPASWRRLAPADAADACSTGLFNPVLGDWDEDILDFVMAGGSNNATKLGKLRELLGEVEKDGGIEVSGRLRLRMQALSWGHILTRFITDSQFTFAARPHRVLLRPALWLQSECVLRSLVLYSSLTHLFEDCIIAPFTGPEPATFLSFPLTSTTPPPTASHHRPPRDALISLSSIAETDVLLAPCEQYVPAQERSIICHPAKAWWENPLAGGTKSGEGEGEVNGTPEFVAVISCVCLHFFGESLRLCFHRAALATPAWEGRSRATCTATGSGTSSRT